jgi:hypothetical protein
MLKSECTSAISSGHGTARCGVILDTLASARDQLQLQKHCAGAESRRICVAVRSSHHVQTMACVVWCDVMPLQLGSSGAVLHDADGSGASPQQIAAAAWSSTCRSVSHVQAQSADAAIVSNQETPNSDPYIQDLLKKSDEQREARARVRLQEYYKRNFRVRCLKILAMFVCAMRHYLLARQVGETWAQRALCSPPSRPENHHEVSICSLLTFPRFELCMASS